MTIIRRLLPGRHFTRRSVIAALVMGASLLVNDASQAQQTAARTWGLPSSADIAESFRPWIARAESEYFIQFFRLSPDRAMNIRTIYDEFRQNFSAAAQDSQRRMAAIETTTTQTGGVLPPETQQLANELETEIRTVLGKLGQLSAEGRPGDDPEVLELRDALMKLNAELRDLRGSQGGNETLMASVRAQFRSELDEWEQAAAQLMGDLDVRLRQELTEAELEQWDGWLVDRTWHRWIPQGILSGESVDLTELKRNLRGLVDTESALKMDAIVEAVRPQVAEALLRREAIRRSERFLAMDFSDRREASEAVRASVNREVEARQAVTALLRSAAEDMIALLPGAFAQSGRLEWSQKAYPRVYSFSKLDRLHRAVEQLRDLEPSQQAAIRVIMNDARSELMAARTALFAQIDQWEPEELRRRLIEQRGLRVPSSVPWPDSYVGSWQVLSTLDGSVMRRFREVLSAAQWARLPHHIRSPYDDTNADGS